MKEVTGTLKNVTMVDFWGYWRARGQVYGDTRGRFVDGEWMVTSAVVRGARGDAKIETRNSVYAIENWSDAV